MAESSVKCQVRIIGAKKVVTKRSGGLFVRCYLFVGKNRRIQLNTREIISSKSNGDNIYWDETFSLECNGEQKSISELQEEKIVFELRWRNTKSNLIGQISGSQLVARSDEIPWKSVFEAENMEILKWVSMTPPLKNCDECCCVEVGIKVEVPAVSREEMRRRRRSVRMRNMNECGCGCSSRNRGCCSCVDNELFLIAAVLDVC